MQEKSTDLDNQPEGVDNYLSLELSAEEDDITETALALWMMKNPTLPGLRLWTLVCPLHM